MKHLLAAALIFFATLPATPQTTAPPNSPDAARTGYPFKDTSILKPPAGSKVAVFEFEDLECPVCASDYPIVRQTVAQYKLPFVRRDFPLTEIHLWSFDAAVTARFLQDHVSPATAEEFRRDVFAGQRLIGNKDDLTSFTRRWFQAHNLAQPFVMDATGACKNEVQADRALGDRLGVRGTPCLFVVTRSRWVQVVDITQLSRTIDLALSQTASEPTLPAAKPRRAQVARP